jgi:hypothetical protein
MGSEKWGIDLLVRCLDDSTARISRLSDAPVVQMQTDTGERSHAADIPDANTPKTLATQGDVLGKRTDSSQ